MTIAVQIHYKSGHTFVFIPHTALLALVMDELRLINIEKTKNSNFTGNNLIDVPLNLPLNHKLTHEQDHHLKLTQIELDKDTKPHGCNNCIFLKGIVSMFLLKPQSWHI